MTLIRQALKLSNRLELKLIRPSRRNPIHRIISLQKRIKILEILSRIILEIAHLFENVLISEAIKCCPFQLNFKPKHLRYVNRVPSYQCLESDSHMKNHSDVSLMNEATQINSSNPKIDLWLNISTYN